MGMAAELIREPAAMARRLSSGFDVGFVFESVEHTPFEARITEVSLGASLKLAQLSFSPHRTSRVSRGRTMPSHYLVNQLTEGEALVYQDGREAEVSEGDIYLINPARDFHLETGQITTNSLYVDANAFRQVYPEVDCFAAVPLRRGAETTTMVSNMIDSLFRSTETLHDRARERCGDAFAHVLSIALSAETDGQPSCPSKLIMFHKERIKSFVRDRLNDHQLSCEMIADALKLSQRYIYDVFADEPLTLMRWIRTERLARCRRELGSEVLRNRSVSEIAYSWGFIDLAHFSRVFSAEFGMSPRAYRLSKIGQRGNLN